MAQGNHPGALRAVRGELRLDPGNVEARHLLVRLETP